MNFNLKNFPIKEDYGTLHQLIYARELWKQGFEAGLMLTHLGSLSMLMDMEYETKQLLLSLNNLKGISASIENTVCSIQRKLKKELNEKREDSETERERERRA